MDATPGTLVDITALKLWDDNYNEGDVGAIARSIRQFGMRGAIRVWRDNVVMAGNHTLMALWSMKASGSEPPAGVIAKDGKWYLPANRIIDLSDMDYVEAQAFAIADNETARLSTRDEKQLAQLLVNIQQNKPEILDATSIGADELDELLALLSDEKPDDGRGELLALADVLIKEPKLRPDSGSVYQLGRHTLCVMSPSTDWAEWIPYLQDDAVLVFYGGPFIFTTTLASEVPLVIVQPDTFVSGHMLQQFENMMPSEKIKELRRGRES